MVAIAAAGFAAGAVNTVVGSGSLITYPTMVMLGIPPVAANIANTVGLVPGSVAGAWGYRSELPAIDHKRLGWLGSASAIGAVIGAFLLTRLPAASFKIVVPFLILLAALLVAFQPRIAKRTGAAAGTRWQPLLITVAAAGIYGGYFSAAQGVILLGLLGLFMAAGIQQHNAIKNILQAIVNVVAALFFVATGHVTWLPAGLVAVGSIAGALTGAWIGKRIPARGLRIFVVIFGFAMAALMAWQALRR